jgi:indolepyruvate ferredoxin oxidoreductase beta subunit
LMPVPGELDIVLASELMEAGRAIQRGLVTPDRTTLIASTNRVYSMTEKTALSDGRVDTPRLIEAAKTAARVFVCNDFARIADENGSVISAALFGALAGTRTLPFSREEFEAAIRRSGVGVESSLAGFAAAFAAPPNTQEATALPRIGPLLRSLAARIENSFPPASHTTLRAGIQRLAEYQDVPYGAAYLDELDSVRDLDTERGNGSFTLLCETARYLALWMSYEDAIRVANLKIRNSRFARVHLESRASAKQVVQIEEFLHPGIEEISDILPAALGRWLSNTGWARRLVERLTHKGRIVHTTSVSGFLQLYTLAGMRRWRRRSLRFHEEHKRIGAWLAAIPVLTRVNYALGVEFARCPRIVKGYGDTHTRGRKNFDALMAALPIIRGRQDASEFLQKLSEAALADDSGQKLAEALRDLAA